MVFSRFGALDLIFPGPNNPFANAQLRKAELPLRPPRGGISPSDLARRLSTWPLARIHRVSDAECILNAYLGGAALPTYVER